MQIYTIVIGGLEKSYMQKLVLYLNERLGKSARVELLEHWEIPEQPEVWKMKKQSVGVPMEGSKCWDTGIGSEAFITYLTEQHLVNHTLTVTAQKCTEKAVVYQYQPRDCLYREIVSKCGAGRRQTAVDGIYRRGSEWSTYGIFVVLRLDAIRDKESVVCQFYRMQWNDGIV